MCMQMAHTFIAYLKWILPIFMIFCPVQIDGVDSFCIADTVPLGGIGRVSCHFNEDLSKEPQKDHNFYLYKVSDSEPELVVFYTWNNGQPRIFTEPGYDCTSNLTDYLEILIYNATREHAGVYKCIVDPSTGSQSKACTLSIKEEKSIDSNSSVPSSDLKDQGVNSFCKADKVPLGGVGRVSCHLSEDLSKVPQKDLNVYLYRLFDSEPKLVVYHSWVNGQPSISTEPGYECTSNLTDHLEISINNTNGEHAGVYKCIVAPSKGSQSKACTLIVEKEASADVTQNYTYTADVTQNYTYIADVTQNYTYIVPIVLGCLVLLAAIFIITIIIMKEFRLWPQRWNNFWRTRQSASESADVIAERESLQGNNRLGV